MALLSPGVLQTCSFSSFWGGLPYPLTPVSFSPVLPPHSGGRGGLAFLGRWPPCWWFVYDFSGVWVPWWRNPVGPVQEQCQRLPQYGRRGLWQQLEQPEITDESGDPENKKQWPPGPSLALQCQRTWLSCTGITRLPTFCAWAFVLCVLRLLFRLLQNLLN